MAENKIETLEPVTINGVLRRVIARRAGVSSAEFDKIRFKRSLELIDRLLNLEDWCRQESKTLSDLLENIIGLVQSPNVNGELIQLRRDIYNDRLPKRELSADAYAAITNVVPSQQQNKLLLWIDSRRLRDCLAGEGEAAFSEELDGARAILKRLVRNRAFRRGLSLASPALSRELDRYLCAKTRDCLRRPSRTESALVRYYTRCAFKLSPFSSFMRTGLLDLSNPHFDKASGSARKRHYIRHSVKLNQALVGHLARRIAMHPELKDYVPVFRGATVSSKEGKLLAIHRRYRDWVPTRMLLPQEVIVALPKGPGLRWITDYLERCGGATLRRDLIAALGQPPNDVARATAYIDKLIEFGALVHKIPAREYSDGVKGLARFLSGIASPTAAAIRSSLETLDALERRFRHAEYDKRQSLLEQIEAAFRAAFILLGTDMESGWNGPLVYEDCIDEPALEVPLTEDWRPALNDLSDFLSHYGAMLDGNAVFRETMRHVVKSEFGGGPVPFLQVMGHFENGSPGAPADPWKLNAYTPNPFGLESLDRLADLRREFGEVVAEASDAKELDLKALAESHEWPERVQQLDLAPESSSVFCLSCHCQPVSLTDGSAGLVLNMLNNGPARALLRCSEALQDDRIREQIIADVRRAVRHLWPDAEPCEIIATFDYNANLHPRVTDSSIIYDDLRVGSDDMTLEELTLKIGPGGRLMLIHAPSGRSILPLDLGMMASALKPLMQHFLLSIGNIDAVLHKTPFHQYYWSFKPHQQGPVETFPRLVFGRCIVRRKAWSVAPEKLPVGDPKETDFKYFLRVRRWQRALGLPDEVFVCSEFATEGIRQNQNSRQPWNRRKPQYIHFGNHFLVEVLRKLVGELNARLYIEEALPDRDSWNRWGLRRPTELVLDVCANYDLRRGREFQAEFSEMAPVMPAT